MATQKKSTRLSIGSDPPVMVGGGGSSYLWVDTTQGQTTVNAQSNNPTTGIKPGAPTPNTRANYSASRVLRTPVTIYFHDGVTPGEQQLNIPVLGRNTWYIRFDVPGPKRRRKKVKK